MSRIGKKPVPVPEGVNVRVADGAVEVEGPKGKLSWRPEREMKVVFDQDQRLIRVERPSDQKRHKELHGLTRALVANMVKGVVQGYARKLEIYGTGYSVSVQGRTLALAVGHAEAIRKTIPDGIDVKVDVAGSRSNDEPAVFTISGCDKQLVGEFAAEVRHIRPAEPYGGKGIRYAGEHIRRKAGKTFVSGPA